MTHTFSKYISSHIEAVKKLEAESLLIIDNISSQIIKQLDCGKSIFCFGNGGSSAEASHFVGELVGRFEFALRQPLSAFSLNADISSLTAISNDYGYQDVFSRQVSGLCKKGDILFGLSTSGVSKNVIRAFNVGKSIGTINIMLTGNRTKSIFENIDYTLKVPSQSTAIIQEIHLVLIHHICRKIDEHHENRL